MRKKNIYFIIIACQLSAQASSLPHGFVYLKNIDPTILQDIRYAGSHNFIGRPVKGYAASSCIITKKAALALHQVQQELHQSHLTLKVYDCYRPQMAVNDFISWSKKASQQQMKNEFYATVNKADVFKLGYVSEKSGHTRGSTVDLTMVAIPVKPQAAFQKGQALIPCYKPYKVRYQDNSIDMGTGFDCFDNTAHIDYRDINNPVAFQNRNSLRAIMQKHHFVPYPKEWWHFTLMDEPYPNTYFNFAIVDK